jgi:hypothetical protein
MTTQKTATKLPIATTAELWPVTVIGMGETPTERDKASPEGEVTYASGCVLRMERKDGKLKADKAASVNVINPASTYELGTVYKAKGRVYVQPWESNSRITLSVTVEQLVPADADTGSAPRATTASTSKEKAA